MRRHGIVILALVAMVVATPAPAQGRRHQGGANQGAASQGAEADKVREQGSVPDANTCAMRPSPNCDIKLAIARGLFETGLSPVFPAKAACRGIDEGYAISYTAKRSREQYHGGIDMPAPWGTPMIAAAAGTVVGKFDGERTFRGIEVILRHSPDDTGIPLWIYTQYTHCAEMSALKLGQRVRMGEHLCATGNTGIDRTGTQSKRRRPAIHFAVFFSASERFAETRSAIIPAEGYWMDPVALFRKTLPLDSGSMKALADEEKRIPISIMFENGETLPADTKIVWPYTCTHK